MGRSTECGLGFWTRGWSASLTCVRQQLRAGPQANVPPVHLMNATLSHLSNRYFPAAIAFSVFSFTLGEGPFKKNALGKGKGHVTLAPPGCPSVKAYGRWWR
eukprot:2077375-Pyramimonas_sp.AAC.1